MKPSLCAGLLALAATFATHAETAPSQVATCVACHGAQGQGIPALGAPRLAGQQAEYLLTQLNDFKAGRRGYDPRDSHGAQMRAIAAGLTEGDLALLASYFAGLDAGPERPANLPDTQGKALYQGTCAACHGPRAQGFAHLKTPNLRLLDRAYLERQLVAFSDGSRGGEQHASELAIWMRGIALQLHDEQQRRALLDYIASP
ncbi:c-type cytochrome [Pseudomonas sp. GD03858]|uniref:c-type cytochrome n=1 Tax=unclassified Pseudomonas TaxID=196821 RepID=UPI002447956C|nr:MULTISPECIES: c-type cytochrome [unclassified Pseudomonas]MDH0646963.1 c-type cytochrome [Pseudomonas sp. GD03867]MDH0662694.1 c-type cytochrome [Pseudomonas sp. GD03858]